MTDEQSVGIRQKELVEKIYSVHENLRRNFRRVQQQQQGASNSVESWDSVWEEHKRNVEDLEEYSKAMHELATEVWDVRNLAEDDDVVTGGGSELKCRIQWVIRRLKIDFPMASSSEIETREKKLKLLDVGSCYNPFGRYSGFLDVTAVDLCPAPAAESVVLVCDFLRVTVGDELRKDGGAVRALPRDYYDAIVFSFFLEYLPDPKMRWESCRKAAELLRVGGVLYIIRPDSSSVTPESARLIKKMKVGMGLLGLRRICCEKLRHMWCTAYRRLSGEEARDFQLSRRFRNDVEKIGFAEAGVESELFVISQDFKSIDLREEREVEDFENFSVELVEELPFSQGI